ncbi:MAG TPA: SRPBCC family protein [Thermoanaerobaculia bacterium]|nr:SRPBCC family protein [Thermoanaerobaculia bacterium]
MGIPIEKCFVVAAPAAAVWEFLTDPARVASCLPGAAITGKEGDATWVGTMTVKVGPVTASYRGKLRFERLDAEAREAEIAASGQETRGKGGADMRMKSRVVERGPRETEVTVASDVNVVGVLAQFGRGMIQDVSDQLFRKFTEAMRRQLEEAREAPRGAGEGTVGREAATMAAAATQPPTVMATTTVATATTAAGAGREVVEAPQAPAAASSSSERSAGYVPPAPSAAPPPPPLPSAENVLDIGAFGSAALGRAAMRTLRRPGFWIAVALVVVIVYWLATRSS